MFINFTFQRLLRKKKILKKLSLSFQIFFSVFKKKTKAHENHSHISKAFYRHMLIKMQQLGGVNKTVDS